MPAPYPIPSLDRRVQLADGGTVQLTLHPTRLLRDQNAVHALLASSSDPVIAGLDVSAWANKLYRPVMLIAAEHGEVVGVVHAQLANRYRPGDWRSDGVAVHDLRTAGQHRGRGIGSALIAALRALAPDKPMKVYNALSTARSFYTATGAHFSAQSALGEWPPLRPARR